MNLNDLKEQVIDIFYVIFINNNSHIIIGKN